jgi:hypothetical protein
MTIVRTPGERDYEAGMVGAKFKQEISKEDLREFCAFYEIGFDEWLYDLEKNEGKLVMTSVILNVPVGTEKEWVDKLSKDERLAKINLEYLYTGEEVEEMEKWRRSQKTGEENE